jgi:hypothetical protein
MSADTPRSPAAPGESLEGAHQALHSTLAALVARLRRADEATLTEVKATLTTLASGDNGSRVRDELENLAKGELLEVKWEIEEVIEATTPKKAPPPAPPPAPAPAAKPAAKAPARPGAKPAPAARPPAEGARMSAADFVLVYDDPRGITLHKSKEGDRWVLTQPDPYTGAPTTYNLRPQEVEAVKAQLEGSPYWVIGGA